MMFYPPNPFNMYAYRDDPKKAMAMMNPTNPFAMYAAFGMNPPPAPKPYEAKKNTKKAFDYRAYQLGPNAPDPVAWFAQGWRK